MWLKKIASGKKQLIISKKEWETLGKKAGWIKKADDYQTKDVPEQFKSDKTYEYWLEKIKENPDSYEETPEEFKTKELKGLAGK